MGSRLELQTILEALIGSEHVYFQPPESKKIEYPCIIYSRSVGNTRFADDNPYIHKIGYQVMVIDRNPDSPLPLKVAMLPMCIFSRHYTANNLNHDVYDIYY